MCAVGVVLGEGFGCCGCSALALNCFIEPSPHTRHFVHISARINFLLFLFSPEEIMKKATQLPFLSHYRYFDFI